MQKKEFLELIESKLNSQQDTVIESFQNLRTEILISRPHAGVWSISDCFSHLNSYGDYYLPLLGNAIKTNDQKMQDPVYKRSFIGNYLINKTDPEKGKAKLKAHKRHLPPGGHDPYEAIAGHLDQQENLLKLTRMAIHSDINASCVPISIFKPIRLSTGEILEFITLHNERHILQALKTLEILNSKVSV